MQRYHNLVLLFLLFSLTSRAQTSLFETNDDFPQEYLSNLFFPGTARIESANLFGSDRQFTVYEDVFSAFPVGEGLLFTTGDYSPANIPGFPLNMTMGGFYNSLLLEDLTQSAAPTFDPVILTVTFRPLVDSLLFRFAFASEEHPQYSCSTYNDVMGIYLEGPNYPQPQNISEIAPFEPVGVSSVFCFGNDFLPTGSLMGYNAISNVFERWVPVNICGLYTMHIVLTDVDDTQLDSGIFLEPIKPVTPNTIQTTSDYVYVEGCSTKPVEVKLKWNDYFSPVTYEFGGTASMPDDYSLSIPAAGNVFNSNVFFKPEIVNDNIPDEGEYFTLTVRSENPGCQIEGTLLYYIAELDSTEQTVCVDSVPAFKPQEPAVLNFQQNSPLNFQFDFLKSSLSTAGFPYEYLMSPFMLEEVCLNATTNNNGQLRLYLESPMMSKLELTTSNGSGNQLTNSCFSPLASVKFDGIAPATGRYEPEGLWSALGKPPVNGLWSLLAKGGGTIQNWRMRLTKSFLYREFDYLWPDGQTSSHALIAAADTAQTLVVKLDNDLMSMDMPVRIIPQSAENVYLTPSICYGDTLELYGQQFYANQLTADISIGNCDSIIHIDVALLPAPLTILQQTLCADDQVVVGQQVFNSQNPTGVVHFSSSSGCDSIVEVDLTFRPVTNIPVEMTICANDSLQVGNDVYNSQHPSGVTVLYYENGCDSVRYNVNLTIFPAPTTYLSPDLCAGDVLLVGDILFTESMPNGIVHLNTWQGCDSIIQVHLNYLPPNIVSLMPSLCAGETFEAGGQIFDASNPVGAIYLTSAAGCDSIILVNATFGQGITATINETLCAGQTLTVGGTIFDAQNPGGTVTVASPSGCDTVYIVDLNFWPPNITSVRPILCTGQTYEAGGVVFDEANPDGILYLTSAAGCDSVIMVNVSFVPAFMTSIQETLCAGQSMTVAGVIFNEQHPSGTINLETNAGCDSIITVSLQFLPITLAGLVQEICYGDTLVIGSDIYHAQHTSGQTILSYPNGCDSLRLFVNINVLPVYLDTIEASIAAGEIFTLGNQTYSQSGTYVQNLTTTDGCDSTLVLVLDVASGTTDPQAMGIRFSPNPTNGKIVIQATQEAELPAHWSLLDAQGRVLIERGTGHEIDLSYLPSGVYWVRMLWRDRIATAKVIRE